MVRSFVRFLFIILFPVIVLSTCSLGPSYNNTGSGTSYFTMTHALVYYPNNSYAVGTMAVAQYWEHSNVTLWTNAYRVFGGFFIGWALTPTGPVVYGDAQTITMPTNTLYLYAKWTNGYTNIAIYVSTNGNDTNDGSIGSPVRTINRGFTLAMNVNSTNIYVQAGVYYPAYGIDITNAGVTINKMNNLRLIGGWDGSFTTHTDRSVLDGSNSIPSVIKAYQSSNITIQGFVIKSGYTTGLGSYGGGLYLENVNNSFILDNLVMSNRINESGAGMYLIGSSNRIVSDFLYNTSAWAGVNGGGMYIQNGVNNFISNRVVGNYAGGTGGGICLIGGFSNTLYVYAANNNVTYGSGGGIAIGNCSLSTIVVTSVSNNAQLGGGLAMGSCNSNQVSCFIQYCSVSGSYAGLYLSSSSYNTVTGYFGNNLSTYGSGGGIGIENGRNNDISGTIVSNGAVFLGGGIFVGTGVSNLTVHDSEITENYSTGNAWTINSVVLFSGINSGIVLSNNRIGGNDGMSCRGVVNKDGGTSNITLIDNVFLTNRLLYLFTDEQVFGVITQFVTNGGAWTNINYPVETNIILTTNNRVTNL